MLEFGHGVPRMSAAVQVELLGKSSPTLPESSTREVMVVVASPGVRMRDMRLGKRAVGGGGVSVGRELCFCGLKPPGSA